MELMMTLPKMHGLEVSPGVYLIGEPTPIPGTSRLRCIADFYGFLAVIELNIKFSKEETKA